MTGSGTTSYRPPEVVSVASSLLGPYGQDEIAEVAKSLLPQIEPAKVQAVFDNTGIECRHLARAPHLYGQSVRPSVRHEMANTLALEHGARAAEIALTQVDLDPDEVDTLIFVSTTVLRSPNLDVSLAETLGMRRSVRRIPMFGLASLGGATALGLAADLVNGGDEVVLVVAAEMNSLTFVPGDASMESLVTLALFSDGAAAAVVRSNQGSVDSTQIVGHCSTLVPDSLAVMGFDVTDEGLRWRLAPDVPEVARTWARETVDEALSNVGWKAEDLDHLLVHPGGTKVLDAVEETLGLAPGQLHWSRQVMRDHGNLSSATVLLVLERFLDSRPHGGRGLLTAMGPGFAFEHVVFTVGDGLAEVRGRPVA